MTLYRQTEEEMEEMEVQMTLPVIVDTIPIDLVVNIVVIMVLQMEVIVALHMIHKKQVCADVGFSFCLYPILIQITYFKVLNNRLIFQHRQAFISNSSTIASTFVEIIILGRLTIKAANSWLGYKSSKEIIQTMKGTKENLRHSIHKGT